MSIEDNQDLTTEITIAPDGRVFVFGMSKSILEILAALNPTDRRVQLLCAASRRELSVEL